MDLKGFRNQIRFRKRQWALGKRWEDHCMVRKYWWKQLTFVHDMINQSRNGWNPDQRVVKRLMKNNHTSLLSQKLKFFVNRSQLDSITWKLPTPSLTSSLLYCPPSFLPFFPIKIFLGFNKWSTTVIKN